MNAGLHALLGRAVDYTSMLAPASMSLSEAFDSYYEFQNSPDNWLLRSLVLPIEELERIPPYLDLSKSENPLVASVVGRGGSDPFQWRKNLSEDLEHIDHFLLSHAERIQIRTFEVELPVVDCADFQGDDAAIRRLIASGPPAPSELTGMLSFADRQLARYHKIWPKIYLSSPRRRMPGPQWLGAIAEVAIYIAGHSSNRMGLLVNAQGGPLEQSFLSEIASFLLICSRFEIQSKARGIFHILRSQPLDYAAGEMCYLSLLMAAVLAVELRIDSRDIMNILSEPCELAFSSDDEGCKWCSGSKPDYRIDLARITSARNRGLTSLGVYDLDELRLDLRG